jgi:sRNA-binding regulator protein Hfq
VFDAALEFGLMAWGEQSAQFLMDLRHVTERVQFLLNGFQLRGDVDGVTT